MNKLSILAVFLFVTCVGLFIFDKVKDEKEGKDEIIE